MKAVTQMKCKEWLSQYQENKLQSLQDRIADILNISLGLMSSDGKPITVWSNSSLVCAKIKFSNLESCMREKQRLIRYVCEKRSPVKYTCYMGMTSFACPVVYEGEVVAIFLGSGMIEEGESDVKQDMFQNMPRISKEKLNEVIEFASCLVELLSTKKSSDDQEPVGQRESADGDYAFLKKKLTLRELDVVKLINCGLSNKEISAQLNISEKTVKTHITNILRKLKLKGRLEVILYCKNYVS